MNCLIFGAGAIGTYIGGSLALDGHRVTFIEQTRVAGELRKQGLRLDLRLDKRRGVDEPFILSAKHDPIDFVSTLKEALSKASFDVAVFALKSFDTTAAVESIKPFAKQMPPVLCLQNGVDNEDSLATVLGRDSVLYGTVTSSIGRRAAGDIVLERLRGVGVAETHPLACRLVKVLNQALLNARLFARPADMKWSKMLTNLIGNASAAILDMTPAEVFNHPGLCRLEMQMLRETLDVMRRQHIRVVDLPATPVRLLAMAARLPVTVARPLLVKAVGGGRGKKMPSFHIDLHAGRNQSEVAWLNGAVVRAGTRLGVATPINQLLTDTLSKLFRRELPLSEFRRQPEKLLALAIHSREGNPPGTRG